MKKSQKNLCVRRLVFACSTMAVLFSSCVKDNFNLKEDFSDQIEWNPSLALPVAKGDLMVNRLLNADTIDYLSYVDESKFGYSTTDDKIIQFNYVVDTARAIEFLPLPLVEQFDTTLFLKPVEIASISMPIGYITLNDLFNDNFTSSDYNTMLSQSATHMFNMSEMSAIAAKKYYLKDFSIDDLSEEVKSFIRANFGEMQSIEDVFEYIELCKGDVKLSVTNSSGLAFYCDVVVSSDRNGTSEEFGVFDFSGYPQWISAGGPQWRERKGSIYKDNTAYLNNQMYFTLENLRVGQSNNVVVTDINKEGLMFNLDMSNLVALRGKAYVEAQEMREDTLVNMTFNADNARLYSVLVDRGEFKYELESTMDIATQFFAEFPSVDSLGHEVRKFAGMKNGEHYFSNTWSLKNCNIDCTTNPEHPYNSVPMLLSYQVNTEAGMLEFGPEQYIKLTITNTDSINYSYVDGSLARSTEDIFGETLNFDLTEYLGEKITFEEIKLHDPRVSINFENPTGVGGELELFMESVSEDGVKVNLFDGGYSNRWKVERSSDCALVKQGTSATTSIKLNNKTSNIVNFLSNMPKTIEYYGKFHINSDVPVGEFPLNCLSNHGSARLGVTVELPMNMSAKQMAFTQDFDINMSDLFDEGDISSVERVRLYLNTSHQLPVDLQLRVAIYDTTRAADQQFLGEIFDNVISAAETNEYGKVEKDVRQKDVFEITLEREKDALLEKLFEANKLRLQVILNSSQMGEVPVLFYSYYGLKFNLAADCRFTYTRQ